LVLNQAPGKTGRKPGFSAQSREAVPKTEVLEQLQYKKRHLIIPKGKRIFLRI
jgi:hypothetical protein